MSVRFSFASAEQKNVEMAQGPRNCGASGAARPSRKRKRRERMRSTVASCQPQQSQAATCCKVLGTAKLVWPKCSLLCSSQAALNTVFLWPTFWAQPHSVEGDPLAMPHDLTAFTAHAWLATERTSGSNVRHSERRESKTSGRTGIDERTVLKASPYQLIEKKSECFPVLPRS